MKNLKADGRSRRAGGTHGKIKKSKRRQERRAANRDPEVPATYGRYKGWET